MLLSGGMMEKKVFKVSNPPAEAPIPMIGKLMPCFGFFTCLFGLSALFFSCGLLLFLFFYSRLQFFEGMIICLCYFCFSCFFVFYRF